MPTSAIPTAAPPLAAPTGSRHAVTRALARVRHPELLLLLVLAAVLNLWNLSVNGNANDYYAATVTSMTMSWSNFFFGSFDPAGLMTVDKPPLALWVQAASVKLFGMSPWSMLAPQAIMGVLTTGLVYDLTRRPFGRAAGFVAGLTLALTPTAVAVFRHNNPDAAVMLLSTLAVWALVRALHSGRSRWLAIAGVAVGLGFTAKMGAALMVAPAIAAAWLWMRPQGLRREIGGVSAFAGSAAVVGLAWPLAVWLTPAADRPWISGTSDNSIWSLILGYNGFGRLLGQDGGPGGGASGPGGGGGVGSMFGGDTGALRLLNDSLGSQGGWLLGLAIGAGVLLVVATRLRRDDVRTGWLVAVGGSFAITAVAFSFASGIFHPYYVSALAPFTAALVGAGIGVLLSLAKAPAHGAQAAPHGGLRTLRVVGGLALLAGAVTEFVVLDGAGQLEWLAPVLLAGTAVAGMVLVLAASARVRTAAVVAAAGLLLIAPATWSAQTPGYATSSTFPAGGPQSTGAGGPGGGFGRGRGGGRPDGGMGRPSGGPGGGSAGAPPVGGFGGGAPGAGSAGAPPAGGFGGGPPGTTGGGAMPSAGGTGGGGMFGGDQSTVSEALAYARASGGGTLAVSGQSGAAPQIIASQADIAGIGGFSGRESEVTMRWFADRVDEGRLRFVLTGSDGLRDARTGSSTVMSAVAEHCTAVSSVDGLYDCKGAASALGQAAS